ncbi:MAG: VanZ family protein [Actinomycetota bacterium]
MSKSPKPRLATPPAGEARLTEPRPSRPRPSQPWGALVALAFAGYLVALYRVTLTAAGPPFSHLRRLSLVPFRTLLPDGAPPMSRPLYQFLGNVFLLAPIGLLLACLPHWYLGIRRARVWQVAVLGLLVSGGIETVQYLLANGRVADIDDVISNVTGLVLTYVVVTAASRRWSRQSRRSRRKPERAMIRP